jgi:hypothetical protein
MSKVKKKRLDDKVKVTLMLNPRAAALKNANDHSLPHDILFFPESRDLNTKSVE